MWPEVSALAPLLVNFHQEAHKGTSEMMSSKTSKRFFHHQLHVRIHHTRCVWLCLRALHCATPLQSKMTALGRTALRSKTLESKVTSLLNTQPPVARCMQYPTLHNLAQKLAESSWLVSVPQGRCERGKCQIEAL